MELFLHCAGHHMKADAKADGALFTGEAYPVAWTKADVRTNGRPTHFIWVNDTDKQEHPVRCVLPLQGDESLTVKVRVVETLKNVSLQLIEQLAEPTLTPTPAPVPVPVDSDAHEDH